MEISSPHLHLPAFFFSFKCLSPSHTDFPWSFSPSLLPCYFLPDYSISFLASSTNSLKSWTWRQLLTRNHIISAFLPLHFHLRSLPEGKTKDPEQPRQYLKENSQSADTTWLQDLLASCSNQDSVVLVGEKRQIFQQNRKENPEIDPNKYSQLNFHKGEKTIQRRKGWSFQQVVLEQVVAHMPPTPEKRNLDTDLRCLTKINTNQMINLEAKCKI